MRCHSLLSGRHADGSGWGQLQSGRNKKEDNGTGASFKFVIEQYFQIQLILNNSICNKYQHVQYTSIFWLCIVKWYVLISILFPKLHDFNSWTLTIPWRKWGICYGCNYNKIKLHSKKCNNWNYSKETHLTSCLSRTRVVQALHHLLGEKQFEAGILIILIS